ncbi:antibiotic biosynthesis monooxygenase [Roseateles sp. SL47]|uniref:antibiotic biosynthesis monooxygenase family protein n=1 Tax=Roseateles sp. SL47 TaxID=2995138 RepID=UPI0022703ABC|nr:antibiotic biosynthesis monooxygenase family protein [Roseateles sp. SL47]WAC73510.1 antibiotic biosynthesis monooxygenase [Roseateles sp. SL47]
MFTLIYRWRVHPGRERQFVDAWLRMTEIIREREGSLGSRLHIAEDGLYVAYAQWPSYEAWEASDDIEPTEETVHLRRVISDSAVRLKPDLRMEVIHDLLVPSLVAGP